MLHKNHNIIKIYIQYKMYKNIIYTLKYLYIYIIIETIAEGYHWLLLGYHWLFYFVIAIQE